MKFIILKIIIQHSIISFPAKAYCFLPSLFANVILPKRLKTKEFMKIINSQYSKRKYSQVNVNVMGAAVGIC